MINSLFVTMDGGGNLPPALGIAAEIVRQGGTARFLGHETQRAFVEKAGFRFEAVRVGRDYDATAPRGTVSGVRDLTGVFADRGIGTDAIRNARAEPTDIVVVDCLLLGALDAVQSAGLPTVSLVHSLWSFFQHETRGPIGAIMRLRGVRMRRVLESPILSLVTVRSDFEPTDAPAPPAGVHHVGVVWQGIPSAAAAAPDPPRILVSLSTTRFPGQERFLQSALDALADLPVTAIVTTGPAIDPADVTAPTNAMLYRFVDHSEVMPSCSLVIGHGGHSTTARALAYGLPFIIAPMHPLMDQAAIGRAVERHGAGRMVSKMASPTAIRTAVLDVLGDARYRAAATRLGASIRQQDGAVVAVGLLKGVIASTVTS